MCRLIIGHCQASNVLFTTLIFFCFDSSKHKQNSIFAVLRTFRSLNANIFLPLYKSLLRTHLDYVSSVWAPYKEKYIDKIESVQKQIPGFNNLSYPERLKKLKYQLLYIEESEVIWLRHAKSSTKNMTQKLVLS